MRVLVTGASGMLGSDLVEVLSLSKGWHILGLDHKEGDITDLNGFKETVKRCQPDTIVHCAAFTDVDGCEKNPDKAFKVNGIGARNAALSCREVKASMVFISTDYVFDGVKEEPYDEIDLPNPINVYGRSKLLGEYYVQHLLDRFTIIRTSWLFGANGKNFVKTILGLLKNKDRLTVVEDQVGSPTYTRDLAHKIGEVIEKEDFGVYHATNRGFCSWFEFAVKIMETAGFKGKTIEPIGSKDIDRPAKRPRNSVLENRLLRLEGYSLLRPWEEALVEYLKEVKPH